MSRRNRSKASAFWQSVLARLGIGVLWALHWLPNRVLARVGAGLGALLHLTARSRRHIVNVNLRLCFPDRSEHERRELAKAHFRALGRSLVDRALLWWAPTDRVRQLVRVQGEEKLRALVDAGKPVILLAPHFVGLDAGGAGVAMRFDSLSVYARQKNPVIDRWVYHGRKRFGDQMLLSRDDGVRSTVKAMKSGRPFYYLPDMDFRARDSIFVPFFGNPAATITGLSRLSRLAGAAVVSCATRMLPDGEGYVVEIGDPWPDFPTADVEGDTRRMNEWIESLVLTMPEQYYWVHRRFKTRPPGERKPY